MDDNKRIDKLNARQNEIEKEIDLNKWFENELIEMSRNNFDSSEKYEQDILNFYNKTFSENLTIEDIPEKKKEVRGRRRRRKVEVESKKDVSGFIDRSVYKKTKDLKDELKKIQEEICIILMK